MTVTDLETALREGREDLDAGDLATHTLITAYPDQNLREVLLQLGAEEVGRIPVISREDHKQVVGVLRRHNIIRAYIQSSDQRPKQSPRA